MVASKKLRKVKVIEGVKPKESKPEEKGVWIKRMLGPEEYEVRDITWAVGINCSCGYQLDLFTYNIEEEKVCKKCGKKYDIELKVFELGE